MKAPKDEAVSGSVTFGNLSLAVDFCSPSTKSLTAAVKSGGRPGECAMTRNIHRFSLISAGRCAFSAFATPLCPAENVLTSTPSGLSSAATPSPDAVLNANRAMRLVLPPVGKDSTRIHAANV